MDYTVACHLAIYRYMMEMLKGAIETLTAELEPLGLRISRDEIKISTLISFIRNRFIRNQGANDQKFKKLKGSVWVVLRNFQNSVIQKKYFSEKEEFLLCMYIISFSI